MQNNIIFLDCTQNYGYQYSAANTKVELMARGFGEQGDNCVIHNGLIGTYKVKEATNFEREFADVITYSQKGHQLLSWLFNIKTLYKDLKYRRNRNFHNIMILEYADYHIFLIYVLFARLLHYKIVIIAHEWAPTVPSVHFLRKPYVWLYSKTFGYFADAILPISEYIIERIKYFKTPFLKLPVLADYTKKLNDVQTQYSDYFLYCVQALYAQSIFLIIDAYRQYKHNGTKKLILILSGNQKEISLIKDYAVQLDLNNDVIIMGNLSYNELLAFYKKADALLLPLNPDSPQDNARFSQKVAEYLSSERPIITNNVGEIKYYFENKKNIILASSYSVVGFCEAFIWLENNEKQAHIIGKQGYELGYQQFNYETYGKLLHDFLKE